MEWNRNQKIELAGIKESSGPLDHQTTEVTSKRATAAVLEQQDGLAHRPVRFV